MENLTNAMAQCTLLRVGAGIEEVEHVPLVSASARCAVLDCAATVTLEQVYSNRGGVPIEAMYVFPVDRNAAVCDFRVSIDDRVLVARLEPAAAAKKQYQESVQQDMGAYLLEQTRGDAMTMNVGNLPPGVQVRVSLTYVTQLEQRQYGRVLRFVLPTNMTPPYQSPMHQASQLPAGVDQDAHNGPAEPFVSSSTTAHRVSVSLNMRTSVAMTRVECISHPAAAAITIGAADADAALHASVALTDAVMDRDVVVSITLAAGAAPSLALERWALPSPVPSYAALLTFHPQVPGGAELVQPPQPQDSEVVFVVDRSGSMGGASINAARTALELALRSLMPSMLFNVIGFGSRHDTLFSCSQAYSQATLDQALAYCTSMQADMGGTELMEALASAFALAPEQSRRKQRSVIVMTDGAVGYGQIDALCALAKGNANAMRVFALGIGSSVSRELVDRLAAAGDGCAEYVANASDEMSDKVMLLLQRCIRQPLRDVTLSLPEGWHVKHAEPLVSAPIPTLDYGASVRWFMLLHADAPLDDTDASVLPAVRITGRIAGAPVDWTVSAAAPPVPGVSLHRLAARRVLTNDADTASNEAMTSLALRYNVMCKHVSFVVVDEKPPETTVTPVSVLVANHFTVPLFGANPFTVSLGQTPVPAMLDAANSYTVMLGAANPANPVPALFGAANNVSMASICSLPDDSHFQCSSLMASIPTAPVQQVAHPRRIMAMRHGAARKRRRLTACANSVVAEMPNKARDRGLNTPIHHLVTLQSFDGSWPATATVASHLAASSTLADLTICQPTGITDPTTWATILALAWLHHCHADERLLWDMAAGKAWRYLATVLPGPTVAAIEARLTLTASTTAAPGAAAKATLGELAACISFDSLAAC